MSNLQMIEALCTLCEEQSRIIRAMALRLGELGDTALKDEIARRTPDTARSSEVRNDPTPARKGGKKHEPTRSPRRRRGLLLLLLTLVEIAPIKVNPWSALAKALGRAINADVLKELGAVKQGLADHIRMDDERNADEHRARILRFNNELLRDIPHTKEEFIDILADIDYYERYCDEHKGYKNNRASHAIANISRVYDDRLREHDFLASSSNERDTEDTLDT